MCTIYIMCNILSVAVHILYRHILCIVCIYMICRLYTLYYFLFQINIYQLCCITLGIFPFHSARVTGSGRRPGHPIGFAVAKGFQVNFGSTLGNMGRKLNTINCHKPKPFGLLEKGGYQKMVR